MATIHGRTEIRPAKKKNVMLIVVMVVGLTELVSLPYVASCTMEPKAETKPETVTEGEFIKTFGAYDTREFTKEYSINWETVNNDFEPLDCPMDRETQEFTYYLTEGYGIDFTLVMAIIENESYFDPEVISETEDYGLMQINKINHEWFGEHLGITDFLDAKQNIRAGVYVLRKLFEKYSDVNMVLMAYNMGEEGAKRLWNDGIYNTRYTDRVLGFQQEFIQQKEK